MTNLPEALLNHDPILVTTVKALFRKKLIYLPESKWKQRLIKMSDRHAEERT